MAQINKVAGSADLADGDFTSASAGGDTFENDERTMLFFKNVSAAVRTVTINEATICNFRHAPQHLVLTIAAGSFKLVTDFLIATRFGGKPVITYDDPTGVSVVAIRIGGR